MRILFDHNVPAPLRYSLKGHKVETAYERGWAEITNGMLLTEAETAGFELMITTDQSIRYQQNLTGRSLAIILIDTNDWTVLRQFKPLVLAAIHRIVQGDFIEVEIPRSRRGRPN
jgi:hypothetical protein